MVEMPRSQYAQIAAELRTRIDDGRYPPGSSLPSETRLAEEFGVTRVTINKALTLLRTSGDVKVRRGADTRVRSLPRIIRDAQRPGVVAVEGLEFTTKYIEIAQVSAPSAVAEAMQLGDDESTLVRRRILYANDEPTQIAHSYYPWSIINADKVLMREEVDSHSRLAELGHGPARFTEDVLVRMPDDAEQRTLELEAFQSVLEIKCIAYSAEDVPVETRILVMPSHLWHLRYGGESGTTPDKSRDQRSG